MGARVSWLEDARRIELAQVAVELGLERSRDGHLGPCPSCGEQTRSRRDSRRGPLFTSRSRRWRCGRCDAHGDAIDLVSFVESGRVLDADNASIVRSWFAARGWCLPARDALPVVPSPPRAVVFASSARPLLPAGEARALWSRCPRLSHAPEAIAWVRSRALDPALVEDEDLLRGVPEGVLPPFASHWRRFGVVAVLPLFDAHGQLAGLQGRASAGPRKSVRMRGVACGGLLLASGTARSLLVEGCLEEKIPLEVVEGEPDFLSVLTKRPRAAVLGIPGSGAWTRDLAARIPDGCRVEVATHQDETGESYACLVHRALHPRCPVFRVRWAP